MNPLYPAGKSALLRGEMNLLTDTFKAQLAGYTFDPTHATAADIGGAVGEPALVVVTDVADGAAFADDVTFLAVGGTDEVTAVIVYLDTGDPTTSTLLTCINRRADAVPLAIEPDDGDLSFSFPDYLVQL